MQFLPVLQLSDIIFYFGSVTTRLANRVLYGG